MTARRRNHDHPLWINPACLAVAGFSSPFWNRGCVTPGPKMQTYFVSMPVRSKVACSVAPNAELDSIPYIGKTDFQTACCASAHGMFIIERTTSHRVEFRKKTKEPRFWGESGLIGRAVSQARARQWTSQATREDQDISVGRLAEIFILGCLDRDNSDNIDNIDDNSQKDGGRCERPTWTATSSCDR